MTIQSKAKGESVAASVTRKTVEQLRAAGFTFQKAARELAAISFSNIKDYIEVDNGGEVCYRAFDEIPEGKLKAVKAIKEKTRITESSSGDKLFKDSTREIVLWDKLSALQYGIRLLGEEPAQETTMTHQFSPEMQEMLDKIEKAGSEVITAAAARLKTPGNGNGNGNGKKVKK